MKRVIFFLFICFFLSSGVTSAQLMDSACPMFGINLNHTSQSPYVSYSDGTVKWSYTTGGYIRSSPAIDSNGTIYFGSWDNKLYALYPNGTKKWSYGTGDHIKSSPAIATDGTIYVGSWDNYLYALYPNGTKKWNYYTGNDIESSPVIGVDGIIYIGSVDMKLYAIYPNGTVKWSYTTGGRIDSSPAIDSNGIVYVGSYDSDLYAIYPNGTKKWNYNTGGYTISSPAIATDGTIYIGSWDNKLYAINSNGTLKWSYTTGDNIKSSPAIATDGTIYFGSWDNKLYALYPNGTKKWSYTVGNDIESPPVIASDGTIYVGSEDKKLYAFKSDGTLKWSYLTGGYIDSSPAIAPDGTIYVGSAYDYKLHAFESIIPTVVISSTITQNSVPLTSTLITGDDSTGGFVSENGQMTLEPNERDNKTFSLEVTDSALIDGFELAITADSTDVLTLVININNLGSDRTYNIYLDDQFLEKIGEVTTYQYNMTSFSTHTLKIEYDISEEDAGGGGGPITPPDEDLIEIGELILTKDEFDLLTIEQIEALNVSQDTKDKLIAIKSINVNWWLFILVISLTGLIVEGSHKKGHESIIIISFIGVVISAYKLGYF